jgi:hypothetical protein
VVNSLTKPDCLIYQTGLSSFDSSNSAASFVKFQNHLFTTPPLGDIKGLSMILIMTLSLLAYFTYISIDIIIYALGARHGLLKSS